MQIPYITSVNSMSGIQLLIMRRVIAALKLINAECQVLQTSGTITLIAHVMSLAFVG